MAARGEEVGSTVSSKCFELRSPTSLINSPLYFTEEVTRVPLQTILCGKLNMGNEKCWLEYEPRSKNLKLFCKDEKHFDHEYCTSLTCRKISAVDLRVSAKFDNLDAMTGTLIVECRELVEIDVPHHRESTASSRSYLLEATFHVNCTGQVRDILRSLRVANLGEAAEDCETVSVEGGARGVADIAMSCSEKELREGLPDWTPHIPHRVYSPAVRRLIESAITLYTIFSSLWAVWQLYSHVDFIRAYVQPIIDTLKYHVQLLDKCIQFLNSLFEEMTKQWFAYVTPGYVILSLFASPLIAAGREMWTAFVSISTAYAVSLQPLYHVFEPLFKIIYMVFIKTPYTIFQPAFAVGAKCCLLCYNTVFCHIVLPQLVRIKGALGWLVEILEKSMKLDLLKAHLVLMRSMVINSGKALSSGLVYIFKGIERRVWLMIARPVDNKDD